MNWNSFMETLCESDAADTEKSAMLESVTPADITGDMLGACAIYLLDRAEKLDITSDAIDLCGTGGDKSRQGVKTFNISTAASFVVSAGGVAVVKHGNRAVSGNTGSSDALECLGLPPSTTALHAQETFSYHNICFVAAPAFHPALKSLAHIRRALGRPTFLNLLGPLCNPARTKRQIIGVFSAEYLEPVASAAQIIGKTAVTVLHSEDGLDEISISAPTDTAILVDGDIKTLKLSPENAGIPRADLETLACDNAEQSAKIIEQIFAGETGPRHDIVCINAAAAFVAAGKDDTLALGVYRARHILKSGLARQKLMAMRG